MPCEWTIKNYILNYLCSHVFDLRITIPRWTVSVIHLVIQ